MKKKNTRGIITTYSTTIYLSFSSLEITKYPSTSVDRTKPSLNSESPRRSSCSISLLWSSVYPQPNGDGGKVGRVCIARVKLVFSWTVLYHRPSYPTYAVVRRHAEVILGSAKKWHSTASPSTLAPLRHHNVRCMLRVSYDSLDGLRSALKLTTNCALSRETPPSAPVLSPWLKLVCASRVGGQARSRHP